MHHVLDDRRLVRVSGAEAGGFLQNLVTCDIRAVTPDCIQYGCLLGAQGRLLNEFFVLPDGAGGYLLDCDASAVPDLIRRLAMYKLRAKVDIAPAEGHVTATTDEGWPDPRLTELGRRLYTKEKRAGDAGYDDLCISLGVPPFAAMRVDKDFLTDLNLDLLNAVSFEKGCFVGQELAARMEHRGLAKRRLLIVEGEGLAPGQKIEQDGVAMGEIRMADSAGRKALALLKLDILQKNPANIRPPPYMLKNG